MTKEFQIYAELVNSKSSFVCTYAYTFVSPIVVTLFIQTLVFASDTFRFCCLSFIESAAKINARRTMQHIQPLWSPCQADFSVLMTVCSLTKILIVLTGTYNRPELTELLLL